ncbi:DUF2334 domain-containing protein [Hippea alviniae]|uniref:DUF2334 domain-containing protein n=1 Tax=Hippea alviniae TaxID=1279027 RepID=UPI0003B73D8B|nr:DUF2334 domain-containing protein [Hippea alviniae]
MSAKYIVRFDDASPTMNKKKWQRVERLCDEYNIKPIVAIVPNNKDSDLVCDSYDSSFWSKVKDWQDKGWYIALHGYEHKYVTQNSGLVPINNRSEFAGLSYEEQKEKIEKGMRIFKEHGIEPNIWVAPAHSFDKNTLLALREVGISIVSDGIALYPFVKYGFKWIPQQLWHFRVMPFGVWTICLHPNKMGKDDFKNMEDFIKKNKESFIDVSSLKYKNFCVLNMIFGKVYWPIRRLRSMMRKGKS